ncbi:futalosine hydrolase [Streptomyces camelliae]|uniref:Futalosine hydrolase n=1 Tax=Streptomyces camelliae TaxID=3004093 RepID=A0ABY7P6J6_9ACTN|nr:futalosine hydrolase [Streptomyces sp. HUAS 2-6]WBO65534.1 futalosine hydrolase [Streptomyces sp. HUAS 2-6]
MVLQAEEGLLTTPSARILVATAVPAERDAVARAFSSPDSQDSPDSPVEQIWQPGVGLTRTTRTAGVWDLLDAGVGPARAAASVSAALTAARLAGTPYDLVVSAGIGGGFQPEAPVGSLVVARRITVADLGAETADGFLPVTDLGFGTVHHYPPRSLVRVACQATGAPAGTILTVSTVTGTAARAAELRARHPQALAEGMEGFGVAEAADAHGTAVLEVRAVSNPVGPRDRAAWRIGDALTALTEAFGKLAPALESWNRHDDQ